MNTLLRQPSAVETTLARLPEPTHPSLLDRAALHIALRLLLWSARRSARRPDARTLAAIRAREERERRWQRDLFLTLTHR